MSVTAGPVPASDAGGGPAHRPYADCTSDSSGGLTFSVPLLDGARARNAALLLRRRGGTTAADTVRLPLAPGGGPPTAVLPGGSPLPEGRWDVHLALGEAQPRRLLPGVHDLRSLLGRTPPPGGAPLCVRIPYATRYGNLTVRAWLRPTHAEAGRLDFAAGVMVLHGRLYGVTASSAARLEARPRSAAATRPDAPVRTVPVLLRGGPDGEQGSAFTAELPCAALAGAAVWDLWLRPGGGAGPVRVARILDDVHDKKRIFRYPAQRLTGASGTFTVRPYYTLDNDLAVRVEAAEEAASRGTASPG